MEIHLGSMQSIKANAVKDVLYFFKVVKEESKSDVAEQPYGEFEIMLGARNRTQGLKLPSVGLETGIVRR